MRLIHSCLSVALLGATPVLAENPPSIADLLAGHKTELQGALTACTAAVLDPAQGRLLLKAAGFEASPGYEGTTDLIKGDLYVMMWDEPGFCMVEDLKTGTDDMQDTFLATMDQTPESETDDSGCPVYLLDGNIRATLSGPGQDPVCQSDTGAALRFELTQ